MFFYRNRTEVTEKMKVFPTQLLVTSIRSDKISFVGTIFSHRDSKQLNENSGVLFVKIKLNALGLHLYPLNTKIRYNKIRLQKLKNYFVSELNIYPVKSLRGFSLNSAEVTDRGFKYDRRWMLVDEDHKFFTQRTVKKMSLVQTGIENDSLILFDKLNPGDRIETSLKPESSKTGKAVVWDDTVDVITCDTGVNSWISDKLDINCKLVYMPDETERKVDPNFAENNEITSLADGYPFLIIGEESLNLLNSKLDEPLPMNRFRPNIVFSGGEPHDEDKWNQFRINDIIFKPIKPCSRCVVTTVNQETGEQGTEPLKTLSTYRRTENNKVMFGMNLLHEGKGKINVGDELRVT